VVAVVAVVAQDHQVVVASAAADLARLKRASCTNTRDGDGSHRVLHRLLPHDAGVEDVEEQRKPAPGGALAQRRGPALLATATAQHALEQ